MLENISIRTAQDSSNVAPLKSKKEKMILLPFDVVGLLGSMHYLGTVRGFSYTVG